MQRSIPWRSSPAKPHRPQTIVSERRSPSAANGGSANRDLSEEGRGYWSEIVCAGCWKPSKEIIRALGERFVCHLGLKTGANHVFLIPPEDLEPEVLRWAVRGRDIAAFQCVPRTRLLWTHDAVGQPRAGLPPRCTAYLIRHHSELRARRDYGWAAWTVFRVRPAIARHRVVWSDLARQLVAAALTTRNDLHQIPLNSCYVATMKSVVEAERLTACLNSTWLRAAARLGAVPAASGFARFNAQTIARLPLPQLGLRRPRPYAARPGGAAGALVQEELDEASRGIWAFPVTRRMHFVPWWPAPPAIVAESLMAVSDPLLTALRPGPLSYGAAVAASLAGVCHPRRIVSSHLNGCCLRSNAASAECWPR